LFFYPPIRLWLIAPLTKGGRGDFFSSLVLIEFARFDYLSSGRDVDFYLFVTSKISLRCHFFFCEAIIYKISCSIVEIEWVHRSWEELSECSFCIHLSEDFVCFFVSFFFGVLFVENAEGFVFESDTAEAVGVSYQTITIIRLETIVDIRTVVDIL
jgi:hypothetical protein